MPAYDVCSLLCPGRCGQNAHTSRSGVYDLFHFGHALQLRQAKLAFPSVPPDNLDVPISASSVSPLAPVPSTPRTPAEIDTEWTPGVYMLAGVNSDEQCEEHKRKTVMTHAERSVSLSSALFYQFLTQITRRCEAVRHCRWVDEVVPDAPWVIGEEFLQKVRPFPLILSLLSISICSFCPCHRPWLLCPACPLI